MFGEGDTLLKVGVALMSLAVALVVAAVQLRDLARGATRPAGVFGRDYAA